MTWLELGSLIEQEAATESYIHGPQHWRCVAKAGLLLCQDVPEADPKIVLLFGMLHDSQRHNDDADPEHGPRAAAYACQLRTRGVLEIEDSAMDALVLTCDTHTFASPTRDMRVGVCYDADRLNLWRVGIEPHADYLSTEAARRPEWLTRTQDWHESDLAWDEVIALMP